jgi:hypothetical protein
LPVGEEERKGEGGVYSSQLPPRPSLASTFEPSHLIIAIHFYGSHNEAINYLNPNYFFLTKNRKKHSPCQCAEHLVCVAAVCWCRPDSCAVDHTEQINDRLLLLVEAACRSGCRCGTDGTRGDVTATTDDRRRRRARQT